ncbi:MAG: phosphatidate cytidylyltransferase [Thermoleophilia bacterium]
MAIPGIVIAIAAVAIGGIVFALAVALIAVLGLNELYSLTAAQRPLRWAGYLGTVLVILLAWADDSPEHGILIGMAASLGLVAIAGLILARRDDVTSRMTTTLFGVAYLGVPLGLLVATRQLPEGGAAVANVLVGVWVFDTASYAGGKIWGKTPIAPRTSAKKTVEGALVGLVLGVLGVWIAGWYMDWISGWQSLILGLAICPAAFLGDLFESMLKRDAGAKDSGRILLGHGGVLDRFDALLFAACASYFVTIALVY